MYNSQQIAENIKNMAKKRKINIGDLLSSCELGVNTIYKISKGNDILTKNFAKIADCLNCSVDYLLGRTEIPELLNLPPLLASEINNQFVSKQNEYINIQQIVKAPFMNIKFYFVHKENWQKIIAIYDTCIEAEVSKIISKKDYINLFDYNPYFCSYGAGYVFTQKSYDIFFKVYELYNKQFAHIMQTN